MRFGALLGICYEEGRRSDYIAREAWNFEECRWGSLGVEGLFSVSHVRVVVLERRLHPKSRRFDVGGALRGRAFVSRRACGGKVVVRWVTRPRLLRPRGTPTHSCTVKAHGNLQNGVKPRVTVELPTAPPHFHHRPDGPRRDLFIAARVQRIHAHTR